MRIAQVFVSSCALVTLFLAGWPAPAMDVAWWVSSEDMQHTMTAQPALSFGPEAPGADVRIDDANRYQSILGLGASLDHATCYNISQLPPGEQERAVEWIVSPYTGIGMNLMRICIGTPDVTASPWYTYADIPDDMQLEHFSIEKDREYVLPVLKMALEINPDLLFFASPWSPPGWMTSNGQIGGGRFISEYYAVYARYLAKFITAYEAEGIPVYAITLQNEPDYNPPTYPTCRWSFGQQAEFIAGHVGPEFARQGIQTRIWCWDHNFEPIGWPRNVLNDPAAAPYIDGTAFHHYAGRPVAMARLSAMFPSKHIYFTEGSTSGVRGAIEIIAILRNWARSYNAWVTVIDDTGQPNRGPHRIGPTCIVLDSATKTLLYSYDYCMYGQFMRFIQRDAVRIESTDFRSVRFANAAFLNPDGSIALVVANADRKPSTFTIAWRGKSFAAEVPARATATFVWYTEGTGAPVNAAEVTNGPPRP